MIKHYRKINKFVFQIFVRLCDIYKDLHDHKGGNFLICQNCQTDLSKNSVTLSLLDYDCKGSVYFDTCKFFLHIEQKNFQ